MDGILLINKPAGMTSHDVVMKVRRFLHTKKVGHCGTLDPDATGVLVVCVNKATKAIQFITANEKEYIAVLSLGKSTDTYDASGKILEEKEFNGISHLEETVSSFIGKQLQIPPIYSAIKVNGKKLYEYARENKEVEIKPREVEIKELEILKVENNEITMRVLCSKGTYIRSLCFDLAKQLGYPGHMKSLIRSQSGDFKLENCYSLEDIEMGNYEMISIDEAFNDYQKIIIEDENIVKHGKLIKSDLNEDVAVYSKDGHVLAIYTPAGNGYLKSKRGLF
jgi:tRNA pseudouridine55 synthase